MNSPMPAWVKRLLPHLQGAVLVAKWVYQLEANVAALILTAWIVVGTVSGYATPPTLTRLVIGGALVGFRYRRSARPPRR